MNWLIGVYGEELITVDEDEARYFSKYNWLDETLLSNQLLDARAKLRPYFFILEPAEGAKIVAGSNEVLENHGLGACAYELGDFVPIPAFGFVEDGRRFCIGKELLDKVRCRTLPQSGVCALVVRTRGVGTRTGTLFKFGYDGERMVFEPCVRGTGKDTRYLVGKGILQGIKGVLFSLKRFSSFGTMGKGEAAQEMQCPASKLCAKFADKRYVVYREVSTDLRADMPLALLKISQRNGFEDTFYGLGRSIRHQYGTFGHLRTRLFERDILLDGTIVDYAGIRYRRSEKRVMVRAKRAVRNMLFFSAVLSVGHVEGLRAIAGGRKKVQDFVEGHAKYVCAGYAAFFERFVQGGGERANVDFKELEGPENVRRFFSYQEARVWEFWKWGLWTRIGWWTVRKLT